MQFRVNLYVFGPWDEVGASGGNPQRSRENTQTPQTFQTSTYKTQSLTCFIHHLFMIWNKLETELNFKLRTWGLFQRSAPLNQGLCFIKLSLRLFPHMSTYVVLSSFTCISCINAFYVACKELLLALLLKRCTLTLTCLALWIATGIKHSVSIEVIPLQTGYQIIPLGWKYF